MKTSLKRRINITSCWASSRITLLDSVERYEDSYAITQEFCEWITCLHNHPEGLEESVISLPNSFENQISKESADKDELLEL
tara:strand:+ start:186 stop:431 length:246 start_codon:yes stop_codon:yes gene_type:complete